MDDATLAELFPATPEGSRIEDSPGIPFILADGRAWLLAVPRKRLRPIFTPKPDPFGLRDPEAPPAVDTTFEVRWDYPRPLSKMIELFLAAATDPDPEATVSLALVVRIGFDLLKLCHDLTAEQAASLFDLTTDEATHLAVGLLRMFRGDVLDGAPSEEPSPSEPTAG